jgi:hypothetical protein
VVYCERGYGRGTTAAWTIFVCAERSAFFAHLDRCFASYVPGGACALRLPTPLRPRGEDGPPEAVTEETRRFRPHLLIRNDNDGVDPQVLAGIPYWIEVLYSDSMNARIRADEHVTEVRDMAIDDLLRLVDEKVELVSGA